VFAVADPRAMLGVLARLSWPFAALAFLVTLGDRMLMALKWRLLLTCRGVPLDAWTAIRAYFATSFAGLVLPITVGADAIRVMAVRRFGVYDVAASVVVERTLGALAILTVSLAALTGLHELARELPGGPGVALSVLGVGMVVAFALSLRLAASWRWQPERGPLRHVARLVQAYAAYATKRGSLGVFYVLSIIECGFPVLIGWLSARGLGLDLPLSLFATTIPLTLIVARLPVSLGGFGVQEASFVYFSGLFGVDPTNALAIMLVTDAVLILALLPAAFDSGMLRLGRDAGGADEQAR
jgi:glycosyltransferase 2 family protein